MLFVNNLPITKNTFPNGETFIENLKATPPITITMVFESDCDIIHLKMVKDFYDSKNIPARLIMPYVPYERMDRTEKDRLFTLKSVCSLINFMNFTSVTVMEAHSDVCTALLDRVNPVNVMPTIVSNLIMKEKIDKTKNIILVYPDAGAAKRYEKQFKGYEYVTCLKIRDFTSGEITGFKINDEITMKNFTAIIVDDLCSGGKTFMFAGEAIKKFNPKNIYLAVAHCENNIFNGKILKTDVIEKVYTTDSLVREAHEKIKTLSFKLLLDDTNNSI